MQMRATPAIFANAYAKERKMKGIYKLLLITFCVVLLDQLSKGYLLYLITGGVPVSGSAWTIVPFPYLMRHVTDFFNIVFTWNPGASFSLFRSLGEGAPLMIIIGTGAIIGFIGYYAVRRASRGDLPALALILGGALGNLIDRIRFGAVVDFLDFHIGAIHWPAFNVADICICMGVGLYVLQWIVGYYQKSKGKK